MKLFFSSSLIFLDFICVTRCLEIKNTSLIENNLILHGRHEVYPTPQGMNYLTGMFIGKLASLANESSESRQFDRMKLVLETELRFLENLAPEVVPYSHEVIKRVKFARYMFYALANSNESFKIFRENGRLSSYWYKLVLRLNMDILVMHISNKYEDLDQTNKYADAVSLHYSHLKVWADIFKYLADVPVSLRVMITNQIEEAEIFLREWMERPGVG